MEISMKSFVVLVTGASGGIGAAIAELMAEAGAVVVIHYNKNKSAAASVMEKLKGSDHMMVQADITNPNEIQHMMDQVIKKYGRLDVLVNNAG